MADPVFKAKVVEVDADVKTALREVAARHGWTVKVGTVRYDPVAGSMRCTVEMMTTTVNGMDRERADFERLCGLFNLEARHYGAPFTNRGTAYTLVGFEMGRSRFPLRGRRVSDGKILLFTDATARLIAGRPAVEVAP